MKQKDITAWEKFEKSLKMSKGWSEAENRRRPENTMVKKKKKDKQWSTKQNA